MMSPIGRLGQEVKRLVILRTRPSRVIAWAGLNLLFFVLFAGALTYRAELQRREAQAALRTAVVTLATSYAEQVGITVGTVDEQTLTLKHYVEEGLTRLDLVKQWNKGLFGAHRLNGIAITDKEGNILTSTFAGRTATSMASLPFFGEYRSGRLNGLHIFPPSAGIPGDTPIIRFVRDIRRPDGAFDGVVVIGCLPSYFVSSSVNSRLRKQDFLTIRDFTGIVYVRQIQDGIGLGKSMFRRPQVMPTKQGFQEVPGSDFIDGIPRYVAWAPIGGTTLLALSGLSLDDALVTYRQSQKEYLGWVIAWGLFLAATSIAGLALYAKLLHRAHEAERVKRTYRLATEVAGEGFYILEPVRNPLGEVVDFSICDCNALGARFMDFESIDLIGKTISEIYTSHYGSQLIALFRKALERGFDDSEVRLPSSSRYKVEWIHRKMVAAEGTLAVTVVDISAKKQQEKALRDSANHDALTGLPNRHWLTAYLREAVDVAQDAESNIAFFFVDLDNFKDINDTLGHHAGDLVLRETAARLQMAVRPQDAVIRLGGDEFTVLIEGVGEKTDVQKLAERILIELGKPLLIDGKPVSTLGGSVGISRYPEDAKTADELLKHADIAMYVAKTNGKMCFAFYSPEFGLLRAARLEIERELRDAIINRDFVVHFQPRLNVRTGIVVGAEALVRWRHPTKGLIAPAEFIGLAEQSGLILDIGEIVIDIVCAQIEKWSCEGALVVPISINVSPIQFNRRDVAAFVIENAEKRSIPARLLEIELTEAAMLESRDVHMQFSALRAFGVKLLVDDFGTGYSSLAQMQHFHLDVLKIDQSLTAKLGEGHEAKVFYEAIVAMGHALSMSVTAEGVETREQLDILDELKCDEIQGFLIAKPLTGERFQEFLKDYKAHNYRDQYAHAELG